MDSNRIVPIDLKTNLSSMIVPDVLDEAPSSKLTVVYNGKELEIGDELTPLEVKDEPKVCWNADPHKYYLLCMVDPDAPTRKFSFLSPINHWLVGNIVGSNLATGEILVEYRGSGPPRFSGLHRYIFLVYEQINGKIDFQMNKINKDVLRGRTSFSIRKFAESHQLNKPVFGNYFVAQWNVDPNDKSLCIII